MSGPRGPSEEILRFILMFLGLWTGVQAAVFENPDVTLAVSAKLQERMDRKDSLLPAFNPEAQLRTLMLSRPEIWGFDDLDKSLKLATRLKVEFLFLDGIREDMSCELLAAKKDSSEMPLEWSLRVGVDFISGGSNIVGDHVRLCLEQTREALGVTLRDGDKLVYVPPKKLQAEIDSNRINAVLSPITQTKILGVSKEVARTKQCPRDIRSYALLLDVWKQGRQSWVDVFQIEKDLGLSENPARKVTSCSFNRDWNQRYASEMELSCNPQTEKCNVWKSQDGKKTWKLNLAREVYEFEGSSFLGLRWGKQSIHRGGDVLDLRWIPLAKNLYLEAFLDEAKEPVALGVLTIRDEP